MLVAELVALGTIEDVRDVLTSHRPRRLLLACVAVVALGACQPDSPPKSQRPERQATTRTTLAAPSALGPEVTPDGAVRAAQPAVIETVVPAGRARLAVAFFALPCQRLHSVEVTENRTEVELSARLGMTEEGTAETGACGGSPRLAHTMVRLDAPLAGRTIATR